MGSKIRTMWMTPFYLFFGVMSVYLLKSRINTKKLNHSFIGFYFYFFYHQHFMLTFQFQKLTKGQIIQEQRLQKKFN